MQAYHPHPLSPPRLSACTIDTPFVFLLLLSSEVTSNLMLLLRRAGYALHSSAELEIAREVKEKVSFFAHPTLYMCLSSTFPTTPLTSCCLIASAPVPPMHVDVLRGSRPGGRRAALRAATPCQGHCARRLRRFQSGQ